MHRKRPPHRSRAGALAVALPLTSAALAGACGTDATADRDDRPTTTTPSATTASTSPTLTGPGAALDVHTHIASQLLTDAFTGGGVAAAGADDLVARLDEANVERAVVLSAGYLGTPVGLVDDSNMAPENDYVASEVASHADRLIGFCGINPLFDSAPAEVERCLALPGMVGVKLHLECPDHYSPGAEPSIRGVGIRHCCQ